MGRFNLVWKTLRTLSVIMCAVCMPSLCAAFSVAENTTTVLGSSCFIKTDQDVAPNARIPIYSAWYDVVENEWIERYADPDGRYWSAYSRDVPDTFGNIPIDKKFLGRCLNVNVSAISELKQTGANPDLTYATQTYMGFSFKLSTATKYVPAGYNHFYIGTPPTAPSAPTSLVATPS